MLEPPAEGPREGGMGWVGGDPLWEQFHIGYRILNMELCRKDYANIVSFTEQLHIQAHAVKFSQSGLKSHYASSQKSNKRLIFEKVLETVFFTCFPGIQCVGINYF